MSGPLRLSSFVNGQFSGATGSDWLPSVNPSRPNDTVAHVPTGTDSDVDDAVSSALAAFRAWGGLSGPQRGDHLFAWADRIRARNEELSLAIALEVGKPISEARGEVSRCVAILRYCAGEAVRAVGEVVPAQTAGPLQYSLRQPLGVVGLVTPWNFPLAIPIWKAAPALAMGNSVVLKPAESSALCAHLLAETSIGLPPGTFNVVHGAGVTVGPRLTSHPNVKAVSFTGSVDVGSKIAKTCAARNAKFQTEMGGKNAAVVLKDADLARAANLVAGGAMRYAGQKCTATSRVVVEKAVWGAFVSELVKAVDALKVGPVEVPETALGPVISKESRDRISASLDSEGSTLLYKSKEVGEGFYVPPTVFGPVDPNCDLAQEELFGPVLALIEADGFEHAIELANATQYGLSTAVFTRDVASALGFVHLVEAGLVRINGDTTGVDPNAPFGGSKASSSGTREQGSVAKDFYTEWKTVQVNP